MVNTTKGRNSVMVGIRIPKAVNTIIEGLAATKGMTVSAFIKLRVEGLVSNVVNQPKSVNTMEAVNTSKVVNTITNRPEGSAFQMPKG